METKKIIDLISSRTGLAKDDTSQLLEHFTKVIADTLESGDIISLPSVGSLESKLRPERYAMHPSTGKKILVPPKLTVVFKPSNILKQKIR